MINLEENQSVIISFAWLASALLAVLIVFFGVDTYNKIKSGGADRDSITVSASGEVFVKPDLAVTTFSVVTEAKTVGDALSENTKKMNAVIEFAKQQGVESKDLKTANFSIFPRYEYERQGLYEPSGKRILVGYEVQQSLEVKIRNMEKIGQIIEGAAEAGANETGNLQFIVDKEDEVKNQARAQAIEKAKAQAEELAGQLGVRLVKITSFVESGGGIPIFYGAEKGMGVGGAGDMAQIETGENTIEVKVSITYEIN